MRLTRSCSLVDATGYMVLSGKVMAFKNVCMEVFSKLTKGSFTGNFSDPHSTECSKMWNTPVSSAAGVLKVMEKALLASSFSMNMRRRGRRPPVPNRSWSVFLSKGSCEGPRDWPWRPGAEQRSARKYSTRPRVAVSNQYGVVMISPRRGNFRYNQPRTI